MTRIEKFGSSLIDKEAIILSFLFISSILIRFYKIPNYLFFGYEQGRDAQIIQNIYKLGQFTLVGPKTSLEGTFHGPWYYYLMTLPYFLARGNPIIALFFLILVCSFTSIVIYFLIKNIYKSKPLAFFAGVLCAFSFELVVYSRWLSNVTLAVPFIALVFFCIWKYKVSKKGIYFVLSVFFASFASQFEMILFFQFGFVYILLFLLKIIKIPNFKSIFFGFLCLIFVLSPLIIFDFRHQHISFNAIVSMFNGTSLTRSYNFNLFNSLYFYQLKIFEVIKRTLFLPDLLILQIIFLIIFIFGLYRYWRLRFDRTVLVFFLVWSFMSLPVIFLAANLDQSYVGTGLGFIGLICLSSLGLWKSQGIRFLFVILFVSIVFSWNLGLYYLNHNENIFFVTIQKDLNLGDQRKVLEFIHRDSAGQPYRFEAFTIPSLHPEGWQYLLQYYYSKDIVNTEAKQVYIVIEKEVYPVWENKWISDLGNTRLVDERIFGLLRVQKRLINSI